MDSFGIWYSPRKVPEPGDEGDGQPQPLANLHVNLWDMSALGTQPFIDIGLLIPDYHALDTVYLYVPFLVDRANVADLSSVLTVKEIADLVFNDSCATATESNGVMTLKREGKEKTILYAFEKSGSALQIEKSDKGKTGHGWSVMKFDISRFSDDSELYGQWKKLYLRFRITSSHIEDELFCDLERKNQFLESGFEATRVVDIKFNMKRNIADEAIQRMRKENNLVLQMDSVHFLLIEPANNDVDSYGPEPKDCRKLEDEWTDYLWLSDKKDTDDKKDVGDLLAFHWKACKKDGDPGVTEYAQMVRVTSAATNWRVISVYILVGIVLNVVASAVFERLGMMWSSIFCAVVIAICLRIGGA